MGLADIVRSGVATAQSVTADLQDSVSHEAWIGHDGTGYAKPAYAPAVARPALVEMKQRKLRLADGSEVTQNAQLTFIGPVEANGAVGRREPIDPRDRLTLPSGHTGPILDVQGLVDTGTHAPYLLEVALG